MGAAVQLQIVTASGTFAFQVEGSYFPRTEAEWKEAANPPEVVALRETWEFRQARFVSADGTVASTWARWLAFKAAIAPSAGARARATSALLVRDPAGANVTLLTIGGTGWEGFRVEALEGETDESEPGASWRTVAACTLRVSAVEKHADVNGIVGWEQTVEVTYEDGRQGVEARTRITTKEGVSAVTKAQAFAGLDASAFGETFLYETNGPDGIEWTTGDDDRPNSRVPTVVDAVSRIRGYGISFGEVEAGESPSSVAYSITTRRTTDDNGALETQIVTHAEARGPGCEAFVSSKRPSVYTDYEEIVEEALLFASGTWTEKRSASASGKAPRIRATITGGRAASWEAGMHGPAIYFHGGMGAYTAAVEVTREFIGSEATRETFRLPGPPEGWTVHQDECEEEEPLLEKEGATAAQNKWVRKVRLVFRCGVLPSTPITALMRSAPEVDSYFYGIAS